MIERPHKKCRVTVHTARPGVLIGKKGADIEKLRSELLDIGAFFADQHAQVHRKPAFTVRALDHHASDAAWRRLLQNMVAVIILMQQLAVLAAAGEPAIDADPQTDGLTL